MIQLFIKYSSDNFKSSIELKKVAVFFGESEHNLLPSGDRKLYGIHYSNSQFFYSCGFTRGTDKKFDFSDVIHYKKLLEILK
jgi:hypothetical protein